MPTRLVALLFVFVFAVDSVYAEAGMPVKKAEMEAQQGMKKRPKSPAQLELIAFTKEQRSKGVKGKELDQAIAQKRAELGMPPAGAKKRGKAAKGSVSCH